MSLKIRDRLASQMTMEELVEMSRMSGKNGAKARAELQHRTGKVFVKPADAIIPEKIPHKVAAPKKHESDKHEGKDDVSEAA